MRSCIDGVGGRERLDYFIFLGLLSCGFVIVFIVFIVFILEVVGEPLPQLSTL